jgi:hypothetical protein
VSGAYQRLITAGPFVGVQDTIPLSSADANRAAGLVNGFIRLPELGADVTARPGFLRRTISNIQGLPTAFNHSWTIGNIRGLTAMQAADGSFWNLALVKAEQGTISPPSTTPTNGEFFGDASGKRAIFVRWDPVTPQYLYAMGGTRSGVSTPLENPFDIDVARLFFQPFAGYLICSDGVNRPLKWDPTNVDPATAPAACLSDLTDAIDPFFGQPTVYAGKLFAIKASDRNTFIWSEENDPDIGYEATGYDNSWTFRQTSSDFLSRLIGTNDALYVFRENSVTAVYGTVNTDFRSSSTLEGIDSNIGTKSPDAVTLVNNQVWFIDQYGRPHKIEPGRGLVPLWARAFETVKDIDTSDSALFQAWARYLPILDCVVFGVRLQGQTGAGQLIVFSGRTEEFLGTWTVANLADARYGAIFRDANFQAQLAMTEFGASSLSFVTQKQDTASDVATDQLATTTAVPFRLQTPRLYGDPEISKMLGRLAVTTQRVENVQAPLLLKVRGSRSSDWTTAQPMNEQPVADGQPGRAVAGIDLRNTRWVQAEVANDPTVAARPTIGQVTIYGQPVQNTDWQSP